MYVLRESKAAERSSDAVNRAAIASDGGLAVP